MPAARGWSAAAFEAVRSIFSLDRAGPPGPGNAAGGRGFFYGQKKTPLPNMHRVLSPEFLIANVCILSPDATVDDSGAVIGLNAGALDVVDVLYGVSRAAGGLLAVKFGRLEAPFERRDRARAWVTSTFAEAGAFCAEACDAALACAGVSRTHSATSLGVTGRALCAAAARAAAPDAENDVAALCALAETMALARRSAMAPDAGRAALRLTLELSIAPEVQRAWPLALPTRRLRDCAPDVFFQHVPLDRAGLCFDAADEPAADDTYDERVLVCAPGESQFHVCSTAGRPRANKRARSTCRVLASTAAAPNETRGSFFWVYSGNASEIGDVNVFPRQSEDAAADLRSARAAVDAAGFDNAYVGVWLNAAEASYELADAAVC
jgi:hypothetical protein